MAIRIGILMIWPYIIQNQLKFVTPLKFLRSYTDKFFKTHTGYKKTDLTNCQVQVLVTWFKIFQNLLFPLKNDYATDRKENWNKTKN